MLAGAEDDQARARRVRQHERVAEQHALAMHHGPAQGSRSGPLPSRIQRMRGSPVAVERDRHAAVVGSGLESGAGRGIRRRDPIGEHLDGAAACEPCGVGGLVAEAEAARTGLAGGEDRQRERHRLGLDASARDRADDPRVPGDGHRRPDAAGRAARDAHDRDDGDRLARLQDRKQIACQLEHAFTLVPACFLRATLS